MCSFVSSTECEKSSSSFSVVGLFPLVEEESRIVNKAAANRTRSLGKLPRLSWRA